MQPLHHITTTTAAYGVPRVVERSRGTAHPTGGLSTRERVARSLLIHPAPVVAQRPLPLR